MDFSLYFSSRRLQGFGEQEGVEVWGAGDGHKTANDTLSIVGLETWP